MPQPLIIMPPAGADQTDEWVKLGMEAQMAGKFHDAERHYRQALRLDPQHVVATQNLAVLFAQMSQLNEALLTIERAVLFSDGKNGIVHTNRALMSLEADRIDDAVESGRKGVEMSPQVETWLALAIILATAGEPAEAVPLYEKVLAQQPNHIQAAPNICFVQTLTDATPSELLVQRRRWYEANRWKGKREGHWLEPLDGRRLRVGYVGGDFKRHSAAMIFGNVILRHDKSAVDVYFYSTLPVDPKADDLTKRFHDFAGENWRDISTASDDDAEALIRKDKIDVLVDLAGHTNGGRLALFTRKPAPIQVTGWGFAHGTGLPEMDYFVADPVAVPKHERQHFAEEISDLPCVVTYLAPEEYGLKGTSRLPYHENDYITFGSYARYEKMSAECLAAFAEILKRVPGSKIQFKDHAFRRPYSIKRVLGAMPGIDQSRIRFSISTPHGEHLQAYQQADLILDPFPHGGGVVALEALYMGVPLVTRYGTQPSGRSAASVLTQMGRKDWVAFSREEYIEKAVALAADTDQLMKVRKTLRADFLDSPVVKGYAAAVESAYLEMVRKLHAAANDNGAPRVKAVNA
jgi:predicted O-linked N-acetylglucosamine transferase (SPINDLY family)